MKTVFSDRHLKHVPQHEVTGGKVMPCFEKPDRVRFIEEAVKSRKMGDFIGPNAFPLSDILAVHGKGYIDFLQNAHAEWRAAGYQGDVFAYAYNVQHPGARPPGFIDGKVGFYTGDGTVPLTDSSWEAIQSSAHVALTALGLVTGGEREAFALCRPPGHHATSVSASGYCFVNNAAVAAQAALKGGMKKVCVLDVDYHHGNGTQEIFYRRDDVLFVSLHGDPNGEYPYFAGYADEKGVGKGEGFNINYPLPFGTDYKSYAPVLADAMARIAAFGPELLVVSLGVDTFRNDPISRFLLDSPDYLRMGETLAGLGAPTLFVMEGGYAVEEIGINVANVLEGYLSAKK